MFDKLIIKNSQAEVIIDDNVVINKPVILGNSCISIKIGYGSFLGENIYIDVPNLTIGEYTTIHKNTTIHGYKSCFIGHNCWIGQNTIIDSIGGTFIGNNVGIGAYSQLWSHVKFGDTLEGCRWNSEKPLIVEDDAWLVGHCIISPIIIHKKAMLLAGGIATKDMEENHIYAGAPAKDVTNKLGFQFEKKDYQEKYDQFTKLYIEFLRLNKITAEEFPIKIKKSTEQTKEEDTTVFYLDTRTYKPTRGFYEYKFMKFLLYDKAKFVPN